MIEAFTHELADFSAPFSLQTIETQIKANLPHASTLLSWAIVSVNQQTSTYCIEGTIKR